VGFPTLQELIEEFEEEEDVVFLSVQTVFEGHRSNTAKKVRQAQKRYDLEIPMGHDPGRHSPRTWPNIMVNYRTGGTPWVIIIDRQGTVVYNDFHIDAQKATRLIQGLLTSRS